jgi:hypothetical protein
MTEDNKPILRDFVFDIKNNGDRLPDVQVYIDGKKADNIKSARIVALPDKQVTVLLEVIPDSVLVKGKVDLDVEDA